MEIDLYELFLSTQSLVLFTCLGLGFLVGNITIGVVRLGATTGVLLVALFFGHLGFSAPSEIQTVGFVLFIYAVGLQAGPRFFSVFLENGPKYIALAAVVSGTGVALAGGLAYALQLDYGLAAGMLAGALTSTPTLAGAQDAVASGVAQLPEGVSALDAVQNISVGYAITYLFGMSGLLLLIQFSPQIFKVNLADEARKLEQTRQHAPGGQSSSVQIVRAYKINNDSAVGKTIRELRTKQLLGGIIQKIKRGSDFIQAEASTVLALDDEIAILAAPSKHVIIRDFFGPEVLDADLLNFRIDSEEIIITKDAAAGKSIDELDINDRYGCFVRSIQRSQIFLPVSPDVVVQKGDMLRVTGERSHLDQLADAIGEVERNVQETDLLTFAFGICAGLVLGTLSVKLGGLTIGLGSAGGLLLAGIGVGFLRSIHPTFGRVPPAARFLLMELGLLFFMVGVGLNAGAGIVDALVSVGPVMIICGMAITAAPVFVGFAFGRKILKLNPAILMGAITGAMTSTPALNILTKTAKSGVPALGYAGTYTFANVLLTLAGTFMMRLF